MTSCSVSISGFCCETAELVRKCRAWYGEYAFHKVYRAVYDFTTIDLSAVYFDISKDRLYTAAPKSLGRRSAQTALHRINDALVRLLAPILSFTAEEVWGHIPRMQGDPESVHLTLFPNPDAITAGIPAEARERVGDWNRLMDVRTAVLKELEVKRQEKFIGAPLEAKVRISANGDVYPLLEQYAGELPGLFIVSEVELENAAAGDLAVTVTRATGEKCERCWKYTNDVGSDAQYPTLCAACSEAVRDILES